MVVGTIDLASSRLNARRPKFDASFPSGEQLPRQFTANFVQRGGGRSPQIQVFIGESKLGDDAICVYHENDGYDFAISFT